MVWRDVPVEVEASGHSHQTRPSLPFPPSPPLLPPPLRYAGASATCCEPVKLLAVYSRDFPIFLETCPSFVQMFTAAASAFASLNSLSAANTNTSDVGFDARLMATAQV